MGVGAVLACLALHISHFWLSLTYIHLDEVILRIQIHSIEHHAQTYTLHTEQTHTQIYQNFACLSSSMAMNQIVLFWSVPFRRFLVNLPQCQWQVLMAIMILNVKVSGLYQLCLLGVWKIYLHLYGDDDGSVMDPIMWIFSNSCLRFLDHPDTLQNKQTLFWPFGHLTFRWWRWWWDDRPNYVDKLGNQLWETDRGAANLKPHLFPILFFNMVAKLPKKEFYSKCLSFQQGDFKYHQIMWLVPNKTVPHPTQRVPNTNRARWNSKSRCARQLKSFQDGTLGSWIWLWSWLLRNVQKLNWKKNRNGLLAKCNKCCLYPP